MAKKRKDSKEHQINKQINYFILRRMWVVIRGRNKDDTIYKALGISRERFTRAIDLGIIQYSDRDWKNAESTGIPREVFTGELRLDFMYKDKEGEPRSIPSEMWEKWATWRFQHKGSVETKVDEKEGEKIEKELLEYMKSAVWANRDTIGTIAFYYICYFFQERKAAPRRPESETIKGYAKEVRAIPFDLLDGCNDEQLRDFRKALLEKAKLIDAILTYKAAKENK